MPRKRSVSQYIISFSSPKKYEYEKRFLLDLDIKNYLYQRNCNDKISEVQTMKNKIDNNIGKVLILNENNSYMPLNNFNKSFSEKKLLTKNSHLKNSQINIFEKSYNYTLQNPKKCEDNFY